MTDGSGAGGAEVEVESRLVRNTGSSFLEEKDKDFIQTQNDPNPGITTTPVEK